MKVPSQKEMSVVPVEDVSVELSGSADGRVHERIVRRLHSRQRGRVSRWVHLVIPVRMLRSLILTTSLKTARKLENSVNLSDMLDVLFKGERLDVGSHSERFMLNIFFNNTVSRTSNKNLLLIKNIRILKQTKDRYKNSKLTKKGYFKYVRS